MSGKLIVLEGIDGSGKSTQFRLLCDALYKDGTEFKRLTFPRYDEPSSTLIRMYLSGEFGTNPDAVNAYAASSFFAVDRYASFVQDWRDFYKNGGLVLTDRYTTSNAIHQGAKMANDERKQYFNWLYDYEFKLMQLPQPDFTFYFSIDVKTALKRLSARQKETSTDADIHEQDISYLKSCADSGSHAAGHFGWYVVNCIKDNNERSIEDIHSEIFSKTKSLIN